MLDLLTKSQFNQYLGTINGISTLSKTLRKLVPDSQTASLKLELNEKLVFKLENMLIERFISKFEGTDQFKE